jgi:hypothetical protein
LWTAGSGGLHFAACSGEDALDADIALMPDYHHQKVILTVTSLSYPGLSATTTISLLAQ